MQWLAAGEMRPPLTVVLINNSGGGIFSFLPIANDVDEDVFAQLWSTPQNVDLAGTHFQHMLATSRSMLSLASWNASGENHNLKRVFCPSWT